MKRSSNIEFFGTMKMYILDEASIIMLRALSRHDISRTGDIPRYACGPTQFRSRDGLAPVIGPYKLGQVA